jgi:hypothetical protein
MSTTLSPTTDRGAIEAPASETDVTSSKLFSIVAILAIVVGIVSILGGFGGLAYTYQAAAVENITTPDDAVIAEAPVRGPLTMWAQSDIITHHQLDRTEGCATPRWTGWCPRSTRTGTRSSARTANRSWSPTRPG